MHDGRLELLRLARALDAFVETPETITRFVNYPNGVLLHLLRRAGKRNEVHAFFHVIDILDRMDRPAHLGEADMKVADSMLSELLLG